jgi:hypothetical protein
MRTPTSACTEGKMFCVFFALIAVSEMNKIKIVTFMGGKRVMNPITKTQRMAMKAFRIDEGIKNIVTNK